MYNNTPEGKIFLLLDVNLDRELCVKIIGFIYSFLALSLSLFLPLPLFVYAFIYNI